MLLLFQSERGSWEGHTIPCSLCAIHTAVGSPVSVIAGRFSNVSPTWSPTMLVEVGDCMARARLGQVWWWGPTPRYQTTPWRTPWTGGQYSVTGHRHDRTMRNIFIFSNTLNWVIFFVRIARFQVKFHQKFLIHYWYKRSLGKIKLTRLPRQCYLPNLRLALFVSTGNIISKLRPRKALSSPGRGYTHNRGAVTTSTWYT